MTSHRKLNLLDVLQAARDLENHLHHGAALEHGCRRPNIRSRLECERHAFGSVLVEQWVRPPRGARIAVAGSLRSTH